MSVRQTIEQDRDGFARRLAAWIAERRWFRSKTKTITGAAIVDVVPVADDDVVFLRIDFQGGESEIYCAPLRAEGDDAFAHGFGDTLLDAIRHERTLRGESGTLRARRLGPEVEAVPSAKVGTAEQSNTAIIFGDRFILKMYRQTVDGPNPEIEVLRFLEGRGTATPRLVGEVEWIADGAHGGGSAAVAMVQTFVTSRGDAWGAMLERLARFLRDVGSSSSSAPDAPTKSPFELLTTDPPNELLAFAAVDLARARRLGERTAALHRALASSKDDPAFAPEPATPAQNDALAHAMRASVRGTLQLLRDREAQLPADARAAAAKVLSHAGDLDQRIVSATERPLASLRTRVHGDYHLGQVLAIDSSAAECDLDFVIIDFEGEPARSLEERRAKSFPLRDVAGMLRSFDYAGASALRAAKPADLAQAERWMRACTAWCSAAFVRGWSDGIAGSAAAPASPAEASALLDLFLLDKAVYEVAYELNNRPDWVAIPLHGLGTLLERAAS